MSQKPDVYLLSGALDSEPYRKKAKKLGAAGFIEKRDQATWLNLCNDQAGKRVIVIDDDPVNLEFSREFLMGFGADVFIFSDPREAIERMKMLAVDTVLSDVDMPFMNGFAVLSAINAMEFD